MASSGPYQSAARLLNQVLWEDNDRGNNTKSKSSLKSLVYDAKTGALLCRPATYALCTAVVQHQAALDAVLADFPNLTTAVRNRGLLYAAVYDLVAGPHRKIQGGGAVKRHILRHQASLVSAWEEYLTKHPPQHNASGDKADKDEHFDSELPPLPRYVRVNTLLTTTEEVINWLQTHVLPVGDGRAGGMTDTKDANHDSSPVIQGTIKVQKDAHIPDLLVLPAVATSRLLAALQDPDHQHRRHHVVLQDKASCLSAYCLVHGFARNIGTDSQDKTMVQDNKHHENPETNADTQWHRRRVYLDACAAPGNKTTHLAALAARAAKLGRLSDGESNINGNASDNLRIYALDRSPTRFAMLRDRVAAHVPSKQQSGVDMHTICADFLQTKGPPYSDTVTDILLDPSCSGSGMYGRHGRATTPQDRLHALRDFQCTALSHALTAFPRAQRVVYSTCSLHEEENEVVVADALQRHGADWALVSPRCLETWSRRGHITEGLTTDQAAALIRVTREDKTNGFFVACFVRKDCTAAAEQETNVALATDALLNSQSSNEPPKPVHSKRGRRGEVLSKGTPQLGKPPTPMTKRPPAWVQQSGKKKKRSRCK
jgi:putative methyltransferase